MEVNFRTWLRDENPKLYDDLATDKEKQTDINYDAEDQELIDKAWEKLKTQEGEADAG